MIRLLVPWRGVCLTRGGFYGMPMTVMPEVYPVIKAERWGTIVVNGGGYEVSLVSVFNP